MIRAAAFRRKSAHRHASKKLPAFCDGRSLWAAREGMRQLPLGAGLRTKRL